MSHPNFARPSLAHSNVDFVSLELAEQSLDKQTVKSIKDGKTGRMSSEVGEDNCNTVIHWFSCITCILIILIEFLVAAGFPLYLQRNKPAGWEL